MEFKQGDVAIGIHPQTQRLCGLWGFCRGDYIGTIEAHGTALVLRRCDIAQNRYVLFDAPGQKNGPVKQQQAKLKTFKPPVYAEVIGAYEEAGGVNRLSVISIDNVTAQKSCHLLDAVDDAFKSQEKK